MTSQTIDEKKKRLADSVGDFIRYWGFKEVHGRIWVYIYLSENPITAKELTKKLGVTKGLVSTALAELIAYQVVEKVNVGDARSSGYQSNTDLFRLLTISCGIVSSNSRQKLEKIVRRWQKKWLVPIRRC